MTAGLGILLFVVYFVVYIVIIYIIIRSAVTKGIDASHTHDLLEKLLRMQEEKNKNNKE